MLISLPWLESFLPVGATPCGYGVFVPKVNGGGAVPPGDGARRACVPAEEKLLTSTAVCRQDGSIGRPSIGRLSSSSNGSDNEPKSNRSISVYIETGTL